MQACEASQLDPEDAEVLRDLSYGQWVIGPETLKTIAGLDILEALRGHAMWCVFWRYPARKLVLAFSAGNIAI